MSDLGVKVEATETFFARLKETARAVDRGETVGARATLSFQSLDGLLGVLTPKRWALLRGLAALGPSSIRRVAKELGRDYKAVHTDVAALTTAGLIERDPEGRVVVPWDRIRAEVDLRAA